MEGAAGDSWNDGVRGEQVLPLINADDTCIRVEAGPGTGKTFGLVRRVERLMHPGGGNVSGDRILVVAFNRVIAKQLREDVNARLDTLNLDGPRPEITTLHGLCLRILGLHTRMLLDHEREAMLYDLFTLAPQLRTEFKTHSKLAQALRDVEAGHLHHDLLADVSSQWLRRHKAELTSDLPAMLLAKMKGGDHPQPRYSHIIVDEFQDLTQAEQELVFRLLEAGGKVVALGDPRQSIYHFRGNNREGLSKLEELSGGSVIDYPMSQCQRCPQRIVEAANTLMVASPATPLTPGSTATDNTHVVIWASPEAEARGMAKAIVDSFKARSDKKHLVMVSRRQFGFMLRDEILALDPAVPINLVFSESPLETWAAREAFIFFSLLTDPDPATWRAWLSYKVAPSHAEYLPPKRNSEAYMKLLSDSNDELTEEKLRAYMEKPSTAGDGEGQGVIKERSRRYFELKERFERHEDPQQFIDALFETTFWVSPEDPRKDMATTDLGILRDLASELLEKAKGRIAVPADQLRSVGHGIRQLIANRDAQPTPDDAPAIQVATLWSAKGVTADHVFVLGLCKEALPGQRPSSYPGTDDEFYAERQRLFYVTLTRSKSTLVLSRPRTIRKSVARRLGLQLPENARNLHTLSISPFLTTITRHLPDAVQGDRWPGCIDD